MDVYNDYIHYIKNKNVEEIDEKKFNEKKFNVIKFMIDEGYIEKNNIYETIEDNIYLYDILCDVLVNKPIPDEIAHSFEDEIKKFLLQIK